MLLCSQYLWLQVKGRHSNVYGLKKKSRLMSLLGSVFTMAMQQIRKRNLRTLEGGYYSSVSLRGTPLVNFWHYAAKSKCAAAGCALWSATHQMTYEEGLRAYLAKVRLSFLDHHCSPVILFSNSCKLFVGCFDLLLCYFRVQ